MDEWIFPEFRNNKNRSSHFALSTQYLGTIKNRLFEHLFDTLIQTNLPSLINYTNLYTIKLRDIGTAQDFVRYLLDDYLFSKEKIIVNGILREIATITASQVFDARKPLYEGIDLEMTRAGIDYLIVFESEADSVEKLVTIKNAISRKVILRNVGTPSSNVRVIYGRFYGANQISSNGEFIELSGKPFWEFVSGDPEYYFYTIQIINEVSVMRNEEFLREYCRRLNIYTSEFIVNYCTNGEVDWSKLSNSN